MWRFSSPRMLYSPSSRRRRFMTKLLAYSSRIAANSATTSTPMYIRLWRYPAPRTEATMSLRVR